MEIVEFNKQRRSLTASQVASETRVTPKSSERTHGQDGEFKPVNLRQVLDKFQGKFKSKAG